jgi:hypothetical protein
MAGIVPSCAVRSCHVRPRAFVRTLADVTTIVSAIRFGRLDAELAALLWTLADGGVPIHVAGDAPADASALATVLRSVARDPGDVSEGSGASLEDVLRQPVPIRPATGAVVVLDGDGRVGATHLHRPPLRDGAGHVRPQGPAVLAARDRERDRWEHFWWGVIAEMAEAVGRRPGDFELEIDRRRDYLAGLASAGLHGDVEVAAALAGYRSASAATGGPPSA